MAPRLRQFLSVTITSIALGCSTASLNYTPGSGWSWGPPLKKPDTFIDQAWREGGGINNPNPERIRQGKPPLNLDGSVYTP
jgi:hypothetical protein